MHKWYQFRFGINFDSIDWNAIKAIRANNFVPFLWLWFCVRRHCVAFPSECVCRFGKRMRKKFKLTTSWVLVVRRETNFWHHDLVGCSSQNSISVTLSFPTAPRNIFTVLFVSGLYSHFQFRLDVYSTRVLYFNIANKRCHFVETSWAHFTRCHGSKI